MKIGIIGLGETGATILALLNQKMSNTVFYVFDPSVDIEGRMLDLRHAAVYNSNTILLNDFHDGQSCNYFFFCAGVRNAKDGDRMDTVDQNKSIIKTVFDKITPSTNAKIIVLTNPVELISEWIYEYLGEKTIVVGTGTGLDMFRLKYLIADYLKIAAKTVDVPVVGEHGKLMVPMFSVGSIGGRKAVEVLTAKERVDLTQALKDSAKNIRKTEEATKYGVAQCAVDLMGSFQKETKTIRYVSYKIPKVLADALGLKYTIFLSVPCAVGQHSITSDWPYDNGLVELKEIKLAADKIEAYYKESQP